MNDNLKNVIREIEIPQELHSRSLAGIGRAERARKAAFGKRALAVAVAAVLMICTTVGGAALASRLYYKTVPEEFNDLTWLQRVEAMWRDDLPINGINGFIEDGFVYEVAGDEIEAEFVKTEEGMLRLDITLNDPTAEPFNDMKWWKLTGWRLYDDYGAQLGGVAFPDTIPYEPYGMLHSYNDKVKVLDDREHLYITLAEPHEYTVEILTFTLKTSDGTVIEIQCKDNLKVTFDGSLVDCGIDDAYFEDWFGSDRYSKFIVRTSP